MGQTLQGAKALREGKVGDHFLVVNEGDAMEARRLRLVAATAVQRSYRFVLICDRNRPRLLQQCMETLDPEDFYFVPRDLNWRAMKGGADDYRYFMLNQVDYLKVAGFLDRPMIIFISHSNTIMFEEDHLARMMQLEEEWPRLMAAYPTLVVCSYMESDEFGSPVPLGQKPFRSLLARHTHYIGASDADIGNALMPIGGKRHG